MTTGGLVRVHRGLVLAVFACTAVMSLVVAGSARATTRTLTVTSFADTDQNGVGSCSSGGSCTLREAVNQANLDTGDTISLQAGTYTLDSSYGALTLTANATLTGLGASSTIISGGNATEIMFIDAPASVSVSDMTLEDGNSGGDEGGAVLINPGASLAISSSVLSGNTSTTDGGAIEDEGTLSVTGSSMTANTGSDGGAIDLDSGTSTPASATVTGSTLSGNQATSTGGAIRVESFSSTGTGTTLTVTSSTLTDNTSGLAGGAIEDSNGGDPAQISITDSTITDNTATGVYGGGGVYLGNGATADQVVNDTIVGNKATGTGSGGGDVLLGGGVAPVFENTIVADGTALSGPDCSASVTDGGHNLDDADGCGFTAAPTGTDLVNTAPDLGPLQSNGGPTETMALLAGSPAINAGSNTGCPATDQRGVPRPQGGTCDIGAYESAPPVPGTAGASLVGAVDAVIAAPVANPDVQAGTVAFQYGTSTAYTTTTSGQALPASTPATTYAAVLSGLAPGTVYHFRVVASDPDGTVYGPDEQFTTATAAPLPPPVLPTNVFTFGKVKVSSSGKLTVSLGAPDAGSFTAKATFSVRKTVTTHKGKKKIVKHVTTTYTFGTGSVKSTGKSTVEIGISLKGSAAKELKKLGSAKVTIAVTFTPTGGVSHKQSTTVEVKRSHRGKYS